MSPETKKKYLTGPQLDARQAISEQTRWRRGKDPELGFPKPTKINGRNYYDLDEVEAWEAKMSAATTETFEPIHFAAARAVDKLKRGRS